ncbi:MAG: hydantoinase/oxoprolinase family protein [bacterium]|nr:hydantoinase/oxoprolinase family protein [bacterium]
MMRRAASDVGGTFTDLVLQDAATGRFTITKVLSTSPDPSIGAIAGFEALIDAANIEAGAVDYLAHASTVASNLVIERSGGRTALLTTEGFRDVLHLQRQKRAVSHDLFYDKPAPLVDRRDILEVPERMAADGSVLVALDERRTAELIAEIAARGIESVAVVLFHAYVNPDHEHRVREIAGEVAPGLLVSLSSDVSPKWREYERSSTTVINAYVKPRVSGYLDGMQASLGRLGISRPLHVMQCSGGLAVVDALKRHPVTLVESGPAAGALMAGILGRVSGRDRIIAFDMGGTTAKVSILQDGEPQMVEDFEVAPTTKLRPGSGLPITTPAVDLIEVGTGGGSIAHLELGVLAVGPESSGASPGPACYGYGGDAPTVTDANLVLGYLDADYFLGGDLVLDADAARRVIERDICGLLGLSLEEAAYAIHAVANASMANAMRAMTIQRGFDPRDFGVVAFGGAGPAHAVSIATELGSREILVPANAGVSSAMGLLFAPIKFEFVRTLVTRLETGSLKQMNEVFAELEERGAAGLAEADATEGAGFVRNALMRYVGQGYEVAIGMPPGRLAAGDVAATRARFLATYERIYGYAEPQGELEIVDYRVTAAAPAPPFELPRVERGDAADAAARGSRDCYFPGAGFVESPVWDRYRLSPATSIDGPAIVQERESTTVIPPGAAAIVDEWQNLVVSVGEAP